MKIGQKIRLFPTDWHTYVFDIVFIVLNFTFFPLIGNRIVGWFDLWLAGTGEGLLQVKLSLAFLGFIAYLGLIVSLYLKRFSIQAKQKDFESGETLAIFNVVAVFVIFWLLFVGIIEFLRIVLNENLFIIIPIAIVLLIIGFGLITLAYKLTRRLDKPLNKIEQTQKKEHNWRFNPLTELAANFSLFSYIFLLQCLYYAYIAEIIADSSDGSYLFIAWMFITFLFIYAAPRLIYLRSINEKGSAWLMLLIVFVSTVVGQFLPDYLSWLF